MMIYIGRSKAVFSNTPASAHGLKIKVNVTDIELKCQRFTLKFRTAHIFKIVLMALVYNECDDKC